MGKRPWTEGSRSSEVLGRVIVEAIQGHYGYLDRISKVVKLKMENGAPVADLPPDAQAPAMYEMLERCADNPLIREELPGLWLGIGALLNAANPERASEGKAET